MPGVPPSRSEYRRPGSPKGPRSPRSVRVTRYTVPSIIRAVRYSPSTEYSPAGSGALLSPTLTHITYVDGICTATVRDGSAGSIGTDAHCLASYTTTSESPSRNMLSYLYSPGGGPTGPLKTIDASSGRYESRTSPAEPPDMTRTVSAGRASITVSSPPSRM